MFTFLALCSVLFVVLVSAGIFFARLRDARILTTAAAIAKEPAKPASPDAVVTPVTGTPATTTTTTR